MVRGSHIRFRQRRLQALVVLMCGMVGLWRTDSAKAADKHELAAAVCYSIAKFAQWPQDPGEGGNIYFGVYGGGAPARAFASLEGHPLKGKKLRVAGIHRGTSRDDIQRCSILFTTSAKDLKHALDSTRGSPTLVIHLRSQNETAVESPCVALFESSNKLGFDAYLSPLKERNIQLNSSVLKLAENVHRG